MAEVGETEEKLLAVTREEILSKKLDGVDYRSLSFVKDLGADSLDSVSLVLAYQEAFCIEITDEEASKIKTVGDAIDLVSEKIKDK